jgi:hypothetical protein
VVNKFPVGGKIGLVIENLDAYTGIEQLAGLGRITFQGLTAEDNRSFEHVPPGVVTTRREPQNGDLGYAESSDLLFIWIVATHCVPVIGEKSRSSITFSVNPPFSFFRFVCG